MQSRNTDYLRSQPLFSAMLPLWLQQILLSNVGN